jgi:hypothetical protein
MIPKFREVLIQ